MSLLYKIANIDIYQVVPSPLDYKTFGTVERLQIFDHSAMDYSGNASHFTGNKKYNIKPSDPGVVAFIDFVKIKQIKGYAIYIKYIAVRDDQQGSGLSKNILDKLFEMFSDAQIINCGEILAPQIKKYFLNKKELSKNQVILGKVMC